MTSGRPAGRRDLGTRGRALVAAAAVGTAGILGGWMAASDHSAVTPTSSGTSSSASSTDDGATSTPTFGSDDERAVPGNAVPQSTPSDATTRAS